MTRILLVRHGESTANQEAVFAGGYDIPLTELGHTQAACTAEFLAKHYAVDVIYSSDLCRAYQTAEHCAQRFGLPVCLEKGLREIQGGAWEARPFASLGDTHPEEYGLMMRDFGNSYCPGGESVAELALRVSQTLSRIAKENQGKTILVTTHGTPIRAMQWAATNKDLSAMQAIPWVSNASVTELSWED